MNSVNARRSVLRTLALGSVALLATTREALASLVGRLNAANNVLAGDGFLFTGSTDASGNQTVSTAITALPSVQYDFQIDGNAQGVAPCVKVAYVGGFSDVEFTSNEAKIIDLSVDEQSSKAIYSLIDQGIAPCMTVESEHLSGIPKITVTQFRDAFLPNFIMESGHENGTDVIRSTLLDTFKGTDATWIVETESTGFGKSFKATSYAEGVTPCLITESVGDAASGVVKFTVLDQGIAPCMTVANDSSSGIPIIRAEVEPDADFEIKVGADTYVLQNGALVLAPI